MTEEKKSAWTRLEDAVKHGKSKYLVALSTAYESVEKRQVKLFRVDSADLMLLFQCLSSEQTVRITAPDFPADAVIKDVRFNPNRGCWDIQVWSASFDVVGKNLNPPLGDNLALEVEEKKVIG